LKPVETWTKAANALPLGIFFNSSLILSTGLSNKTAPDEA